MKFELKKSFKITIGILFVISAILSSLLILAYLILNRSLPDYSKELEVSGIINPVDIFRDKNAVAFIRANKEEEAAFALGFAHAQERLFQMDIYRRAAEGRLSEVFGSRTVPFDKMFRTLGFKKLVKNSYPILSEESLKFLTNYSKGVNEYIKTHEGKYPIEFDLLGYDPYEWKPEHSLEIGKLLAWMLNISWWTDISYAQIIEKVGIKKAEEIIPGFINPNLNYSYNFKKEYSHSTLNLKIIDEKFREFLGFTGTQMGSNAWVVNANKSVNGKVLFANDLHLTLQAPILWYMTSIRSDNWNADGFTVPGLPVIIAGKNENIVWGYTNAMVDDSDFYIEELDSTQTFYMLDGQKIPLVILSDTIMVKDSASVIFDIKSSHRGPIISDIHTYNILYPQEKKENFNISMRWTALEKTDDLKPLLDVNKASNWQEFKEAVYNFTAPGQNFIYGDSEGNIGYILGALIPLRKEKAKSQIFDGTKSETDWSGFVKKEDKPQIFNPDKNYISSANNQMDKLYPHYLSNLWEPDSRINRIDELINKDTAFTRKNFKNIQKDFYSNYAVNITRSILKAFEGADIKDENLFRVLQLFKSWNFKMEGLSQIPSIYSVFLMNLIKNIFEDELGETLLKEYIFIANVPYRIINDIINGKNISWIDDVSTTETETLNDLIRKSLIQSISKLEELSGPDISGWQWENLHKVKFKHMFHGASKLIDRIVDIGPFGIGGDGTTIFNTQYSFTDPYDCVLGPSMRFIYDFNFPDEIYFVLPTGQSGHFFSDHYSDMVERWLEGDLIKINTNTILTGEQKLEKLTLYPQPIN